MKIRIPDTELLRRAEARKIHLARIDECSNALNSIRRDETLARSGIRELESLIAKIKCLQETANQLTLSAQSDPIPSLTEEVFLKRIDLEEAVKKQRMDLEGTLADLICNDDILSPPIYSTEKPITFAILAYEVDDSIRVQVTMEDPSLDV
jgi:hypothetical protein